MVEEIKQKMIRVKNHQKALKELNSQSKTAVWNLLIHIVAFCFSDQRKYFDAHRKEVEISLNNQKSGTLSWYRSKALVFMYGFDLIFDTDKFNTSNATEEQIKKAQIIKYAAVNNAEKAGHIIIKIAGENGGVLSPISGIQEESVKAYFKEIAFAGDRITVINYKADLLLLTIDIYRDPLVLTEDGTSILNGNKPVEDAIKEFLKRLPFNGELILQSLVDVIQLCEGVEIVDLKSAKSSWLNVSIDDYGAPTEISVKRIPKSGYFKVEDFKNIRYVV